MATANVEADEIPHLGLSHSGAIGTAHTFRIVGYSQVTARNCFESQRRKLSSFARRTAEGGCPHMGSPKVFAIRRLELFAGGHTVVAGTLPQASSHAPTAFIFNRIGSALVLHWTLELQSEEDIMQMAITFMAVVGGMVFSLAVAVLAEELIFGQVFRLFFASAKLDRHTVAVESELKR
jgi:hypothetical protein